MYGKALFFTTLVLVGAVLPYVLADDQWLAQIEGWLGADKSQDTQLVTDEPTPGALSRWKQKIADAVSGKPQPIEGEPIENRLAGNASSAPTTNVAPLIGGSSAPSSLADMQPTGGGLAGGRMADLPRLSGPPDLTFEQLLSFQVTQDWLSENWARVTTQVGEVDLQGWRVPVARGAGDQAFAGSMTYFFDPSRVLQRIKLHGYTADPTELHRLATGRYGMSRQPCLLGDLFVAELDQRALGACRIETATVAKVHAKKRCEVLLEINRRGTKYGMSDEFRGCLEHAKSEPASFGPRVALP